MRITLTAAAVTHDVDVTVRDGSAATVVDLASGCCAAHGRAASLASGCITVDGRPVDPRSALADAGLANGSRIDLLSPPPAPPRAARAVAALCVVAGVDAGTATALPPGTAHVGRDPRGDVVLDARTVSRDHARIQVDAAGAVTLADAGSTNGTRIGDRHLTDPETVTPDDRVAMGAVLVAVRPTRADAPGEPPRPARGRDRVALDRPPRPPAPRPPEPVALPPAPATSAGRTPFSWALVVVPIAIGLVTARLFGPTFALFALLSPLVMIATWYEQRRRRAKSDRRAAGDVDRARSQFAREIAAATRTELARRRAAAPDLAELASWARTGAPRLWERRPHHDDFGVVAIGTGTPVWMPPLRDPAGVRPAGAADAVDPSEGRLLDAPVTCSLEAPAVVGICGDERAARALARALVVQVATLHGPADVAVAVLAEAARAAPWAWASWIPGAVVAVGHDAAAATIDRLGPGGWTLLVIDGPDLVNGDDAPVRPVLTRVPPGVAAIVVAGDARGLPATCTTVVTCHDEDGSASVTDTASATVTEPVLVAGVGVAVAADVARSLARFDDPDHRAQGALPPVADLADLLAAPGAPGISAASVASAWSRATACADERLEATVGTTATGPLVVDLVGDGPHALVGGTTGSGKSELLRAIVVSLAAAYGPDRLCFVLVDYKGGAAFDACARLPQVAAVVTDLDEHLGARALRSLGAELRRRERVLREHGAADLAEHRRRARAGGAPAIPRLVVVIDELATLASEVPGFVDALVEVAQRGRSLGMHLVLATQRPHGVISPAIRTNTNLRISLRVLDDADSTDVLGVPDAARIGRDQPGRALMRRGHADVVAFQGARTSAVRRCATTGRAGALSVIRLDPFGRPDDERSHPPPGPEVAARDASTPGARDLDTLTDAIVAAAALLAVEPDASVASGSTAGATEPAPPPWLPPLPVRVRLTDLEPAPHDRPAGLAPVAIGLVDEPDQQRQTPWSWDPAAGSLVVVGMPGSGTTTALTTAALAIARDHGPGAVHLYGIDHDGGLRGLEALPHTGTIVAGHDDEGIEKLVHLLRGEIASRQRRAGTGAPAIVVLIDGFGALRARFDDLAGLHVLDEIGEIARDGPAVGVHLALSGERPQAIPPAITSLTSQRLVLHLADPYDASLLGLAAGPVARDAVPGRGRRPDGAEVQVAVPDEVPLGAAASAASAGEALAAGEAAVGDSRPRPRRIEPLPALVPWASLPRAWHGPRGWALPIGRTDPDLECGVLHLAPGSPALVCGPPGSGRSTTLVVIALAWSATAPGASTIALTPRPSPVREAGHVSVVDSATALAARLASASGPVLVVVDDAEQCDDPGGVLAALAASHDALLVVAGRADRLRAAYGHWTRAVRESRTGVALQPDPDLDGDLFATRLPRRRVRRTLPGRGELVVAGTAELIQVARP